LELGLKPIVVLNKIDKPAARPEWAHEKVLNFLWIWGQIMNNLILRQFMLLLNKGCQVKFE
jgi:predicted membrane GTPase involved in stress response